MNETRNILKPKREILEVLQEYIKENSEIDVWVGLKKIENRTPTIIVEEARNEITSRSTTYDNIIRTLNYKINIYCNNNKKSYEILEELIVLVANVMEGYYHMEGGVIAITPIYSETDKNSWQATLRYTTRFIPSRNKLF